jgi:CDP-glycerol glycerophosphotransferase (TagB/SpsB family)
LFKLSKAELLDFIGEYESQTTMNLAKKIQLYRYVYIYMPTFRDSGDDFLSNCGFNFNIINSVLKDSNRLLILKMHPDSKLASQEEYSNVLIIDKDVDIYPILPLTHCLITDYSSIYYDYILMKDKQVILFIPDLDNYLRNSRDLAFPFEDYTKGIVANSFDDLVDLFMRPINDYSMPNVESIRTTFWMPQYTSMEALINAIIAKLN